jgi:hypothetical protein
MPDIPDIPGIPAIPPEGAFGDFGGISAAGAGGPVEAGGPKDGEAPFPLHMPSYIFVANDDEASLPDAEQS